MLSTKTEKEKKKSRYYGINYSPALPKEGDLNYELTMRRAIPDTYAVRPDYAEYLLKFRAEVVGHEMLVEDGRLSQTYWQPSPLYPTKEVINQIQMGIAKYGCRHTAIPAIYSEFVNRNTKIDFMEILVHLALGVVFLEDYYGFKFKSAKEVEEIRTKNIQKAKKEGLLWGGIFWNSTMFPVPENFIDTKTGNYTASTPSPGEMYCKMLTELIDLGHEDQLTDLAYYKQKILSERKKQKTEKKAKIKQRNLIDMGFTL